MIIEKIIAWFCSPVFFKMQSSRLSGLSVAVEGYRASGVPLVSLEQGQYLPSGLSDDVGLYYFIPKVMAVFHVNVETALRLFFGSIIGLAVIIGAVGMIFFFSNLKARWIGLMGVLAAGIYTFLMWDVYTVSGSIPIMLIPFLLYFGSRGTFSVPFAIFSLFCGVALALGNIVRSHSGMAVLIFFGILVLFHLREKLPKKVILIVFLVVGMAAVKQYFQRTIENRNQFLREAQGKQIPFDNTHPFWHSVYIGLGYLPNNFGIAYRDEIAFNLSRNQTGMSNVPLPIHERIMKKETMQLIKDHPLFILKTLTAKGAAVALYFLLFCNYGIIAAIKAPKPWAIEAAFAAALAYLSLFGLLVIPHPKYLCGFIVVSLLYGATSIGYAKEGRKV